MNSIAEHAVLVLGATGKTGRRVAERLRDAGRAGAHRVPRRNPARSTGRTARPGRRPWTGSRPSYLTYYPDVAVPGAVEATGEFAELAVSSRRDEDGAALRPRRGGERAGRARRPRDGRRAHGAAVHVVHAELQRGLPRRLRPERARSGWPGGDVPGPLRGRRRHRRRRGCRAHRRPPRRGALRAHRAPVAHLRRGRGGDLRGHRPRGRVRPDQHRAVRRRGRRPAACPRR